MSDEETTFNREFDVTKAMREGQASADKFMDNVAAKAAMFKRVLDAFELCVDELYGAIPDRKAKIYWALIDEARALQ